VGEGSPFLLSFSTVRDGTQGSTEGWHDFIRRSGCAAEAEAKGSMRVMAEGRGGSPEGNLGKASKGRGKVFPSLRTLEGWWGRCGGVGGASDQEAR